MDRIVNRLLVAAALSTWAELALLPGPPQECVTTIAESGNRPYLFVPGDATAADGVTVIAPTGGTAGRWFLGDDSISVAPLGGGGDDWARVMGQIAPAVAAYGAKLRLRHGTFNVATNQVTPSFLHLEGEGSGKTHLLSTLVAHAPGGSEASSPFYQDGGVSLGGTTLAGAGNVEGVTTIAVVNGALLNVGAWVAITQGVTRTCQRKILAIGGNNVTIDRPLRRPYTAGSTVNMILGAHDIAISDLSMSGTGDCAFEFIYGREIAIERIDVTTQGGSFTQKAVGFDLSARDCVGRSNNVDGGGVTGWGYAAEEAENIFFYDGSTQRCVAAGVMMPSSDGCIVFGGYHGDHGAGAAGLFLTVNDPSDTLGCRGCGAVGATFAKNQRGAVVSDGSSGNFLTGCTLDYNEIGLYLTTGGSGAASNQTTASQCSFKLNTTSGILCDNDGTGNQILAGTFIDNAQHIVCSPGEMEVFGGDIIDNAVTASLVAFIQAAGATTRLKCHSVRAVSTRTGAGYAVMYTVSTGAKLFIDGASEFIAPAGQNSIGILADNGVVTVRGFRKATGSDGIFAVTATGRVWIGDQVDVGGCVTPYTVAGGSQTNRNLVVLTANNPVNVGWDQIKATDIVLLSRVAVAGGTGLSPLVTINPGVGFSLVSILGDTDTYDTRVIEN